jgi:DNA-binding NarL/FixJ family response regulator
VRSFAASLTLRLAGGHAALSSFAQYFVSNGHSSPISTVGPLLFQRGESANLVAWLTTIADSFPSPPAELEVNLLAAQMAADQSDAAADTLVLEPRERAQEGLAAPLSPRELAVLDCLPSRMRNEDIAAELFITVNTLKTHLRSIYQKLGVENRAQAIRRATEFGLL